MSVNRSVPGSSRQVFAVTVRDMFARLWVSESLGQAEIYHVHVVLLFANTYQEVVWLDITMKKVPRVDEFDPLKHLVCQHQHSFQSEFALAVIQQILQGWTKKIDHHDVVVALDSEPMYVWHTHSAL